MRSLRRAATMLERRAGLPSEETGALTRFQRDYERAIVDSFGRFITLPAEVRTSADAHLALLQRILGDAVPRAPATGAGAVVYRRNASVKGPVAAFGYDYLEDHYPRAGELRLAAFAGARGGGGDYAYEILNFVNGRRQAAEIRDLVSAAYGPVPLDHVVEYMQALQTAGLVEEAKR
jgi:hypothetical protein